MDRMAIRNAAHISFSPLTPVNINLLDLCCFYYHLWHISHLWSCLSVYAHCYRLRILPILLPFVLFIRKIDQILLMYWTSFLLPSFRRLFPEAFWRITSRTFPCLLSRVFVYGVSSLASSPKSMSSASLAVKQITRFN